MLTSKQKKITAYTNMLLRIIAIAISIGVLASVAIFYLLSRSSYNRIDANLSKGKGSLESVYLSNTSTLSLNGEWEYFPQLFIEADSFDKSLLTQPQHIMLPITDFKSAGGDSTYRMQFSIDSAPREELVIFVPVSHNHVNVFINGQPLRSLNAHEIEPSNSRFNSIFFIDHLDVQKELQEVVVSIKADAGALGLFHREMTVSNSSNVFTYQLVATSNEMLIAGMLLIILISGFVFMMFRPNHKMITAMTLFDSLLMMRILFGLDNAFALVNNLIGKPLFTDALCYSLQVLFVFLAGIAGIMLSHDLYDPESHTPKSLTVFPAILYLFFGIFFAINPQLFSPVGIQILMLIFAYTFVGVAWQFVIRFRKGCTPYYALQIAKTVFIGLLILYDIFTWNSTRNFLFILLLYCLFFTIHIGFRLYDNNNSYKQVEVFNRNLERTIEERTHELELANSRLHELSIRDPLTHAYNRLHFERITQEYLLRNKQNGDALHLAMFDLDWFKRVNDSYGHDEGDRQLIFAVECCNRLLPPNGVLSRIGGEEFTVLLTGLSDEFALQWSRNMRSAFEAAKACDEKRTTVSIGLVKYQPQMSSTEFSKQADNCLYEAKNTGRNKICYDFGDGIKVNEN